MFHSRDRQLAKRVLRKEHDAFENCFNIYFSRLYRFCGSRLRGKHAEADIEDIVQETMLKAVRNLHGYRVEASLFTWLCQICQREIAGWYRRQGRRTEAAASIDDPAVRVALEGLAFAASDELDRGQSIENMVHVALDRLPGDYAAALEQKYLAGCTVNEIARQLNRGPIATQSLIARARHRLAPASLEIPQVVRRADAPPCRVADDRPGFEIRGNDAGNPAPSTAAQRFLHPFGILGVFRWFKPHQVAPERGSG